MAFDGTANRVVLFGGLGAEPNDTWEWDGTTWTKVADTGPEGRAAAVLASTGSALFLHGGAANDGTVHGDTWQWADGEWTKLQEVGPAPRFQHAMAFDTDQRRLVLFGGQNAGRIFADTWEVPTTVAGPPP
jgi:N-acetylneuraminic acid mutarotase